MSPDGPDEGTRAESRFADPDDRYRLDSMLATGGMGEVWRATDTRLNRSVAVKLLKPELAGDPTFRSRFATEARNAASLHHANIASVFDFGDGASSELPPWLVMELVRGEPLSELLAGGPLDPAQTRDLLADVADGLGAAHADGIVHRDVKPANLIVTPQRRVKITDFGISRAVDSAAVTRTGEVLGTPHYLSPEQAAGEQATARSDVYALGVVLHECLAGERPFDEGSPVQTALAHLRQEPPPLPEDTPQGLAEVVRTAMSKDPADRYADGADLGRALRRADLGTPPVGAAGDGGGATRVMPGLGAAAAGAAGGAALGAAGGAAAASRGQGDRPAGAGGPGRPGGAAGPGGPARPGGPGGPGRPAARPAAASTGRPGWVPLAWAGLLVLVLLVAAVTILGTQGADRAAAPSEDPTEQTTETAAPEESPTPEPEPTADPEPTAEPEPTTVTVDPASYVGRDEGDARDDLRDLGLDVETEQVANDGSAEEGTVAGVSPTGEVEPGSTVTLLVLDAPAQSDEQSDEAGEAASAPGDKGKGKDKKDEAGGKGAKDAKGKP